MAGATVRAGGARRSFAMAVIAREVLRHCAGVLAKHEIPLMPLKGVLLQRVLYADPASRPLSDVDVIVPEACFAAAITALCEAGLEPQSAGRNLMAVSLRTPLGLPLDLHRRLFARGRYRLSTEDLFRRAWLDRELFGFAVWLPEPKDLFAHMVGKFACDHVRDDDPRRLEELGRVAEHYAFEPKELARHLERRGVARAARFALGSALSAAPHARLAATLRALGSDPIGWGCAEWARRALAGAPHSPLALIPSLHSLNSSLPEGALGLAYNALSSGQHWFLSRSGGRGSRHLAPFFRASRGEARARPRARRGSRLFAANARRGGAAQT